MVAASVTNALPKRLPKTDRTAILSTLKALRAAGYKPEHIFDEDEAEWVTLPSEDGNVADEILGVDDATVLFKGIRLGDSFHVRFVMGNDPTEVVCDHSWRDEGEVGRAAQEALDALFDRYYELEMKS